METINYLLSGMPIILVILLFIFIIFGFISGIMMLFVPFWILGMKRKLKNIENNLRK